LEHNRKRVAKRLASGLMAGALALGGLAISGSSPAGAVPIDEDERIAGGDRYATAALVADEIDDRDTLDTVIVANGENFPDALAGSALINDYEDAALLLVTSDSIPSATEVQMNRIDGSVNDVIVIGGTSAISEAVFEDIENIFDNADVVRIAGADRYETAAEVAAETDWTADYSEVVLLVSGENFADAVTVGGYAAQTGNAILLANGSGIPDATVAALEDALDEGVERVVIVGGTSAVWVGAEEALIELGFSPEGVSRVSGANRYATNLNFNLEQFANSSLPVNKFMDRRASSALAETTGETLDQAGERIILVSGANFPDALSAAGLAFQEDAHIVLVDPVTVGASALTLAAAGASSITFDSATRELVQASLWESTARYVGEDVTVIGGLSAVPTSVLTAVGAAGTANLACQVIAPSRDDDAAADANDDDFVLVAFAGNLQQDNGGANTDELEELTGDASYFELNGDDDFTVVTSTDLSGDGFDDAIILSAGTQMESGDEIEFVGIEQDPDVWADGNYYGLRNVGPCSTTVAEDDDAPTAEWWGVVGGEDFFVQFSESMATDYSSAIEADLTLDGDVDGASCTVIDAGNSQYACEALNGAADEDLTANTTLVLGATTYYDAAGNAADLDDFDSAVLTENPDVELESVSVTCGTVGAGGTKETALQTNFGGTLETSTDGLITIADNGGSDDFLAAAGYAPAFDSNLTFIAGPGADGLAANDWTISLVHERGLLIPSVTVDGTDAVIAIDRYVHSPADVARVWNNSAYGRGGLNPIWVAASSVAFGTLFPVDSLDTEFQTVDHDAGVATVLGVLGAGDLGVADRTCSFTAVLSAPLMSGVSEVATNPTSEGQFRLQFGSASQDLNLRFDDGADTGTVLEGTIEDTEDVMEDVRATLYASGARSSVTG